VACNTFALGLRHLGWSYHVNTQISLAAAMSVAAPGPVIIITGTPGTGKSTHAQRLVEESPVPLQHINVGDWVKEKGWYEEFDNEWQSYTADEDKVGSISGSEATADALGIAGR
jgi:adenylate kinase